jgi:DNA/RNA endonuclease G (NUC1)
MRLLSQTLFFLLVLAVTACSYGDKANALTAEFDSADDFENKLFTGNKIELATFTEPCQYISKAIVASMLSIPVEKVDYRPDMQTKRCAYTIIYDQTTDTPDYTTASISLTQEVTGVEAEWKDNWSVKQAISKSSEWVPNLGKAAIWNDSKSLLEVKFDGYTLQVTPPRGPEKDKSKSKKWAIEMVKLAGFV